MNTQHTPGPWETNRQSGITYVWQGGTSNAIAKVYVDVNEDSEANARLIASAPDLLGVAKYAAGMPDADDMPEWAKELRHRARIAIAKATGETI